MNHTPPPWLVTGEFVDCIAIGPDKFMTVAKVSGFTLIEARANARYIVQACNAYPQLLKRAIHPDAVHVEEIDYGLGCYCVAYKCPHCGKYFEVELPQ